MCVCPKRNFLLTLHIVIFIKSNLDLTNDRKFVKKHALILFPVHLFKLIGTEWSHL